jgi:endonuclease IV
VKNIKNLYVSSSCFKKKNFDIYLKFFLKNNIRNIEFSGVHEYIDLTSLEKKILFYQKKKMKFIFHNYFPAIKEEFVLNLISRKKKDYFLSEKLISNSIKLASKLKIKNYGFHPGYLKECLIKDKKFFFINKLRQYTESEKIFLKRLNLLINKNRKYLKKVDLSLENLFPLPNEKKISLMNSYSEINRIFKNKSVKKNKIKLILDLGHLEITTNLLSLNKEEELSNILKKYKKVINEVHLSGNDSVNDLHLRVKNNPWQIEKLKILKKCLNKNTIYVIESRNLTINQLKEDYKLISKLIK